MRARLLDPRHLDPADRRAWDDLAGRAAEPNPLYEADCVVPAATYQAFGAEVGVVVAEDDGRFYGCMPVRHLRRWHRLRYRVVTTQVRRMIYNGTPLLDPDRGPDAFAAMARLLADEGPSWILDLEEVRDGGPTAEAIRAGARRAGLSLYEAASFERGKLVRRPGDAYRAIHGRKVLYDIERLRRRATEALGGIPMVVDRAGDPAAVEEYMALEAKGYKAQTGVAMHTVAGEPEYFREMCRRFSAAGRLHVLTLAAAGRVLACNIWLRGGDGAFLVKTSYDEELAYFTPGKVLHVLSQTYLHEATPAAWIDTCTFPDNWLLERLYPDRQRVTTFLLPLGRNPLHRFTVEAFIRARRARAQRVARRADATPAAAPAGRGGSATPVAGGPAARP